MSIKPRIRGIRVLKAVSSAVRLNILNLLFDHGSLSYTELMNLSKMSPSRDAGRFAYHLKFLLKADLVEADVESKKYRLTDLGKMVLDVAEEIEKKGLRTQRILVRTSRFSLEEFDANKIVDSLVKEAGMTVEQAKRVAKEAEKRLLKARTRYLTAPLIREVVNGILIEKGLEEHRHKLTRLGLPVHDVSAFLSKGKASLGVSSIYEEFGKNVLEEYTLLKVLPRDVADAHLSGELHVNSLDSWILKPAEVVHDLRFFFKKSLNIESPAPLKSLESALNTVFNVVLRAARETSEMQTLEYFNVFLAPFLRNMEKADVKEALRRFIFNLNQYAEASLNIELTIPRFLADKPAIGAAVSGVYGDFLEETQLLASLMLEFLAEESTPNPLLNPKIVIKIRPETFKEDKAADILLKAHHLASEKGMLYFANISGEDGRLSVFSPSGCKFKADLKGDWELDTLRTGALGIVAVNLPRIAYECGKDKAKFFEFLREKLEMATRALEIKFRALRQRGKSFLHFLLQTVNGDQYFRLENSTRLINMVGLEETVEAFTGKSIYEDENALKFAVETVKYTSEFLSKSDKRRDKRLLPSALPSLEASERLAKQDIERFGVAKVRFQGTREKPYYSTFGRVSIQNLEASLKALAVGKELYGLFAGGNLAVIELGEVECPPETLFSLTRRLVENYGVEFFTYNRDLTYCSHCNKTMFGVLHKCPSCGSVGTLTVFKRYP
ncbi:MAG: anaerobic ribonucleoside-triphosphate reductase [Candidatus Bathyarchaeales archaeon]